MSDYNQHHTSVLAKQFWAQTLAVMVGLREAGEPRMRVSQLERNDRRWLRVLRSLEDEGYVRVEGNRIEGADPEFVITEKISDAVETAPYMGSVRCGTPREPLALWLSTGILKSVCHDLIHGDAGLNVDGSGARRVVKHEGAVGSFAEWMSENLRTLARKYTDIGVPAAQDLRLVVGADVAGSLDMALVDRMKELERLKREVDSLRALRSSVESNGGWEGFIAACRKDFGAS